MLAHRKLCRTAAVGVALVLAIGVGPVTPAAARAASTAATVSGGRAVPVAAERATLAARAAKVKYYEVAASYAGAPENLAEIAVRFLGDASRSPEILDLNVGRTQPDGGAVASPTTLHAGWFLVLPWDAIGDGVHIGALPTAEPPAPPPSATPAPSRSTPTSGGAAPGGAAPGGAVTDGAATATGQPTASSGAPAGGVAGCATSATNGQGSNWAPLRMAPAQAWTRTHGEGVVVAIVDSGVDATRPELTGRVVVGADIVSGSGRGNTDCFGSGTAMAGIIVAQPDQTSSQSGLAPAANILPIRVVTTTPHASAADQAAAIVVAVSAGATVVALGSYVDISDPKVIAAVATAVSHNAVVVACAPSATSGSAGQPPAGLLRVAGVGVDNKLAADYRADGVDVTAPGVGITVIGISGIGDSVSSGTNLAVAFAAGTAALVRSAYPHLTAAQVVHRLEVTSDKLGSAAPNPTYGWGIIDPSAAVNQTIAEEQSTVEPAAPPARDGGDAPAAPAVRNTLALVLIVLIALIAVAAFVFRVRHLVLHRGDGKTVEEDDPLRDAGSSHPGPGLWPEAGAYGEPADFAHAEAASAADVTAPLPAEVTAGATGRRTRGADREYR